jgi:hypothetical protein
VAGDWRAAERLASAESWVMMLRLAHGDLEVAELFAAFAEDDARWLFGAA